MRICTSVRFALAAGVALLAALHAPAAPRVSTHYRLVSEHHGAGGGTAAAGRYQTRGGVTALAAATRTDAGGTTVARAGFLRTLPAVVGLALDAPDAPAREGETMALVALLEFDDNTTVTMDGIEVESISLQAVEGPVNSIDASGRLTLDRVYRDAAASVRGQYQDLNAEIGFVVLNVSDDDFGSYAGDGLPDDWQVGYFGENNAAAGALADPDNDLQNNVAEQVAGTDPLDASSRFRLRIVPVPGQPAQMQLIFGPVFSDRRYTVEARADLMNGAFEELKESKTDDNEPERTVTDLSAAGPSKFYRVQIRHE